MYRRIAVLIMVTALSLNCLAGCNSGADAQLETEKTETIVVSTENIIDDTSIEIETTKVDELISVTLTEEQISGETHPLERNEVYFSFSEEYRTKAKEIFDSYISSGLTEDEAIGQAITDTIDIVMAEESAFFAENCIDYDENGIADGVDSGKYTQSELDTYLYKWYAGEKKRIIDYYASLVKQGEFTKEEAEQYINDSLSSTQNTDATPLP